MLREMLFTFASNSGKLDEMLDREEKGDIAVIALSFYNPGEA